MAPAEQPENDAAGEEQGTVPYGSGHAAVTAAATAASSAAR